MKRILLTLLCLGVLGTAAGCAVGSSASGVSSPGRYGVGAYQGAPSGDDGTRTQKEAQDDQRHERNQGEGFWEWQQDLARAYRGTGQ